MPPLVSVILPTYNRSLMLARAIDSVLGQTCADFELIVVDDGSTDSTAAIRDLYTQEPRIRWLRQPHRGCSAARNAGICAASGRYLAFQDSDDEWLPVKLAVTVNVLAHAALDVGVVYSDMWRVEVDRRIYFPAPDIRRGLLIDAETGDYQAYLLGIQSALLRRQDLEVVGGFDERLPRFTDLDLFIRLSDVCNFVHAREPLVHYYAGEGVSTDRAAFIAARNRLAHKYRARLMTQPNHLAGQYLLIAGALESDGRRWQAGYFAVRALYLAGVDVRMRHNARDLLRRCVSQKFGGRVWANVEESI